MTRASIEAKASSYRRRRLLASTAILWAICCSAPAQANDECGTGTVVICDIGDSAAYFDDFDTGITYDPVADLTLIVAGDVEIVPTSGIEGIDIQSSGGSVHVTLEAGSSIVTTGFLTEGIFIRSAYDVTIDGTVSIDSSGTSILVDQSIDDILVSLSSSTLSAGQSNVLVDRTDAGDVIVDVTYSDLTASFGGINVDRTYSGDVDITMRHSTLSVDYFGLLVGRTYDGDVRLQIEDSTVTSSDIAVLASHTGGNVEIFLTGGTAIISGSYAVSVTQTSGSAHVYCHRSRRRRQPRGRIRRSTWAGCLPSRFGPPS